MPMLYLSARRALLAVLVALSPAAWGEDLATAYNAILKGDYQRGRETIKELIKDGKQNPEVTRVDEWLDGYLDRVVRSRDDVRAKTLAWDLEQAKAAMEAGKTYLALSFVGKALWYAEDEAALRNEPWVGELTERATREAQRWHNEQSWLKADAYYALLARLHPDNKEYQQSREDAERHRRVEYLYRDKKAVDERVKGVTRSLVRDALAYVDRQYYREPDYRAMAEAALRNLLILCETPKLHDVFQGLGDANLRGFFVEKIRARMTGLAKVESMRVKDVADLFAEMRKLNEKSVEIDERVLVMEFVDGAVSSLDEFSGMIWPNEVKDFQKNVMGGFFGVGIQLGTDEVTNRLKVATPLEDSPALEAGIESDDLIVEVDGKPTTGWTPDDAVREITGPADTKVTLTIQRPSSGQTIPFVLTRRQINIKSVKGVDRLPGSDGVRWNFMLDRPQGIAYIRLTQFSPESHDELLAALEAAREQGMKALILDLRFNPGGLLDVAVEVVSAFLSPGKTVVSTEGRRENPAVQKTAGKSEFDDVPLIALVNDNSASAAEILSGALKDYHRALVLGERTFGKGSVQKVLPIGEEARMRLTTAIYKLPSGRSPHKALNDKVWGVDPDVECKLMPKEIKRVFERQRRSDVIRRPNAAVGEKAEPGKTPESKPAEPKSKDEEEDPDPLLSDEDIELLMNKDPVEAADVDPMLETALLLLRTKLASAMVWPQTAANPTSLPPTP
ncbi:MAG: hypothetical protein CHACPFDD_02185 [Phycisphaerae bacterium]|nr:hypothetical protein [Phycisphaerae bacterium]